MKLLFLGSRYFLEFVIPTEANPDFLQGATTHGHVCGFLLRKAA
jgi:hypothetical protein